MSFYYSSCHSTTCSCVTINKQRQKHVCHCLCHCSNQIQLCIILSSELCFGASCVARQKGTSTTTHMHAHAHARTHTHNISIDLIWTATAQTRHKKVLANNYMCSVCKVKEMILIVLLCTSRCLYTKIYRYYNILYFVEFNYLVLVAQQIVVEVLRSSSKLIKFLHKIHVQ